MFKLEIDLFNALHIWHLTPCTPSCTQKYCTSHSLRKLCWDWLAMMNPAPNVYDVLLLFATNSCTGCSVKWWEKRRDGVCDSIESTVSIPHLDDNDNLFTHYELNIYIFILNCNCCWIVSILLYIWNLLRMRNVLENELFNRF